MTTKTSLITENIYQVEIVDLDTWHTHVVVEHAPVEVLQLRYYQLKEELRDAITQRDGRVSEDAWYKVVFYEKPNTGQTQSGPRSHIVYVPPVISKPKLLITGKVGCEHEYNETRLGWCYRTYSCQKCGYSYSIDSGD